ncbi:hypothetical protein HLH33_10140 [Gluconacetobacter diazotrophicus]|uniref:DUF6602 domain-containing protein n=1 Tax=Gluconacetobacter diazotrophicus TaxID=33996 RepID=A0A7W4I5L2_GLUDI|nr:DUF6602 domain-containing protein [Gluconacetobacter diazotrophicus]MBB2156665.1 hypothetical protein [Gluconacetobacter diazotrophicus]
MDTKELFQAISSRMHADFKASAQVSHRGSKGTVRENILRKFLEEGRLPSKYGIGSGEIVGRIKDTSRQSDLIIYDKIDGITLLFDEHTQVYPIDCVYGIIEVKSGLSKAEFIDALDKIAAFKAMAPSGHVSLSIGVATALLPRPKPFGMVFAYNLAGNSLDSLRQNLQEWEQSHPPEHWPNHVCVLGIGTISHQGKDVFQKCLDSESITTDSWPISLEYREDSLWNFYSALHDMCARMKLGPVELMSYYEPLTRIGRFVIDGRFEFQRKSDNAAVRPSESTIAKIVNWCASRSPISYEDYLLKRFGHLPIGLNNRRILDRQVYLYNPDNLAGFHELGDTPFHVDEEGARLSQPSLLTAHEVVIDGYFYAVCIDSLKPEDWEVVPQ